MNTTPFTSKYLEVKIPLKDSIINAFEQSEEYSYLVSDLHSAYDNEACSSVCCILTIAFDMVDSCTHFTIETEAAYTNGDTDTSSIYADFDPVTAEYFRTEAMKQILKDFNEMAKCRHKQLAQTV